MRHASISVVIPCYNEGKTIVPNITRIHHYLSNRFGSFEIIAVNDGSSDDTLAKLHSLKETLGVRVVDDPVNQGKGKAIREGMMIARYDTVMFLDADLAIPIDELGKFFKEVKHGSDIVIASRFVPGLKIIEPVLWYRRIMEKVFRILRMIVLNNYIVRDTQCGFKVFKREVVQHIFPLLTVNRFSFDAEVIFVASKHQYRITELPISLQNPRESHIKLFRDPINMFMDLIRIRYNDLNGKYASQKRSVDPLR